MNPFIKNWKTGITGLFGTVVFGAYLCHLMFGWGKVDAPALTAFGLALTAYQGWVSKDADRGSNAPSSEADNVVKNAVIKGGPAPTRDLETGETVTTVEPK